MSDAPDRRLAGEGLGSAIQAVWDDPEALRGLITATLDEGRAAEVTEAAYRLYEIDPSPERAVVLLALVLRTRADHEGAERVLLDHLRSRGGDAEMWFQLAPLAAWRQNDTDVEAALDHALGYDPNHAQALDWGFRQRLRAADTEAAIRWLWRHSAESWRAHVMLGRQALEWGEVERAMEYFEAASGLGPHDPGPLAEGARALFDNGYDERLSAFVIGRWRGTHGPRPIMLVVRASLRIDNVLDAALAIGRLRGVPIPEEHRSEIAELERLVQEACDRVGI